MKQLLFAIVILISFSCTQQDDNGFIQINHRAGKHKADSNDRTALLFKGHPKTVTIIFNETCIYTHENQLSWNKVIGRGIPEYTKVNDQWVRYIEAWIVWRYNPNLKGWELGQYFRMQGQMMWEVTDTLTQDKPHATVDASFLRGFGSPLRPYFGGRIPAPHDMHYHLKFN
jgi:hypothetical protein